MNYIMSLMILALAIPILDAFRSATIWDKMLAYASVSIKAGVLLLLISVLQEDTMIGFVGAIVLSLGNAGLMLLAYLLKRHEVICD
jgi:multicomponent Na+:H+ antiporter subunit F